MFKNTEEGSTGFPADVDEDEIAIDEINLHTLYLNTRDDGFVNATALCKVGEKKFKDWFELQTTKELIKELVTQIQEETKSHDVIEVTDRKQNRDWIHPDLAVSLAQWISPSFRVQVAQWAYEIMVTGKVTVGKEKSYKELQALKQKV